MMDTGVDKSAGSDAYTLMVLVVPFTYSAYARLTVCPPEMQLSYQNSKTVIARTTFHHRAANFVGRSVVL